MTRRSLWRLFDEVDQILADRPRPYELALADKEKGADEPDDSLTAELRTFSGSFQDYRPKFEAWAAAAPGRKPFAAIFFDSDAALTRHSGLYYPLNTIGQKTALTFNDNSDPDRGRGYDLGTATFSFTVADPIADWADPDQVVIEFPDVADAKKQEARRKRIQDQLKPFSGRVWDPPAVKRRIVAYYRQLGLMPTVLGGGTTNRPKITILEAPRIAGIVLPAKGDKESDGDYNAAIDKILYVLMSDADFRAFIARRADIIVPLPAGLTGAGGPTVDYQSDLGHEGPYLNESRLQVQQLLLSQIGYVSSRQQGEQSNVKQEIFLAVQKIADTKQAPQNTTKPAPATATTSGVVTGHQQEDTRTTEFTPTDKPAGEPLKDHKNYLGFGFEYRPGQGVRFFGLVQRSRLNFPFQDSSVSATAGGGMGGGLGSFNYFADYVGFGTLHRRLSLQANFSSDTDPNRVMATRRVDERRTAGMARIEFEPFRDKSGSLLRLFAEMRQAVVTLADKTNESAADIKHHLTTLDAGSLFTYESVRSEYPKRLRLEPRLRFGLGLADGSPSFRKLTLAGNFHQTLPRRLAADISGRLGIASADTPSFELLSLGGADTVRGFRHDDALGRRLWSLQNELWLPLPHTAADDATGIKAFLRDNVRLAPFADFGGVYAPSGSKAGVRSGYGLGLRVIYGVVTFKLDYAYGVGAAASGGSHGKFYFGVATNLPF